MYSGSPYFVISEPENLKKIKEKSYRLRSPLFLYTYA